VLKNHLYLLIFPLKVKHQPDPSLPIGQKLYELNLASIRFCDVWRLQPVGENLIQESGFIRQQAIVPFKLDSGY
jgi:hypothetical protein